ncbi:hypothetical protein C7974DRAFT_476588 [Boeremia exigua]|uniref:uncharacterized protein n=1 Tax=Boeremia exigua TaxID=749465 RepID=UPI001E8E6289|nr:uncharacterized protein C7974DRAFT_476588 [Boeremia exigua]KAH6611814.1 hypothetical protein C7974DRAFT_476588 [Boeremia exigua]
MAQFRTTQLSSRASNVIPLFWFVRADEQQTKRTQSALNDVVDRVAQKTSELKKMSIVGIPWLRNYAPSITDVVAMARGFNMGEGHVLGIDAQSLVDKTLLVLHCVNGKAPEIGRAAREAAVETLLKDQLYRYTLAEAFDERPWSEIPVPVQPLEPVFKDDNPESILPPHIPIGTKIVEDQVTLFSLIKLTDEEIRVLKQDMGHPADEIVVYNWPHETPASQAQAYTIFQCVKPEIPIQGGQTFVMFIDATHTSGPQRAPVVVVACESASTAVGDGSRSSHLELIQYKHIYLHAERAQEVKGLWRLIWHPPNRGSVNDTMVNYPLFYGAKHRFNDATASRATDWTDPVELYQSSFISKPGTPICATGPVSPDYIVYILSPVTPVELRYLRKTFLTRAADIPQFIELDIVPRRTRTVAAESIEETPAPDSSTRLDPLLTYFDTPAYRAIADPPTTFVFLDNDALDNLLSSVDKDLSVPLATSHYHYHEPDLLAVEEPAYLFANIVIEEGLESTLANLSVGNMWFWELVGCYGDALNAAFWPEYRGSMTREMLNVDW